MRDKYQKHFPWSQCHSISQLDTGDNEFIDDETDVDETLYEYAEEPIINDFDIISSSNNCEAYASDDKEE